MPRTKKAVGTATDKRNGAKLVLASGSLVRPDAPKGLRPEAEAAWSAYWSDVTSGVARIVDHAVVRRWISNLNRCLALLEEADREPVVYGSTGQPKPNGLYDVALRLEASVRADEAQLGIGPKNGANLGLAVISERRSLADMNAQYAAPEVTAVVDHDPRLQAVEGEVV